MPVNNFTNRVPAPVARSTSEVDLTSAGRTGSIQHEPSQDSETPRAGVSLLGLRRQGSRQELQLRQAINQQHVARLERPGGVAQPSVSSQALEEFQTQTTADRLRSREGSVDVATEDGSEALSETEESVDGLDTLSVSSHELASFLGDVFDGALEESDAWSTSSSEPEMGPSGRELLDNWTRWSKSASGTSEEWPRAMAVKTMIDCHSLKLETLDLSGMGLTSLPELLPPSATTLDLSFNEFSVVPANLSEDLYHLNMLENNLTSVPDNLPRGLRILSVSANRIDRLPDAWPEHLINLDVSFNISLTRLSDTVPAELTELIADGCSLRELPDNWPRTLTTLSVQSNQLTSLPENILDQLSQDCEIDVDGNPLQQRVIDRLNELTNAPDYQGPFITYTMDDGVVRPPARPLPEAVAAWSGVDVQSVHQVWNEFASEEGAAEFSQFLDYLKDTVNGRNPAFQQSVVQWLTHLQERPELRRDTFLISQGASVSCEDRISLTFNAMKQARLASDVERGDYDNRLPELITVGRGMFRLDQLESIAREKVRTLNFVDEIEVYLAYQVKLREPLALPLDTFDMRYFGVSWVTQDDLTHARERVQSAEREGFSTYLSSDWQPWQAVMKRLDPTGHERAQEALIEAMGDKFASRLEAQLQDLDLQGDPDAERQLGARVKTEIAREINGQRTQEFLQSRDLLQYLENQS